MRPGTLKQTVALDLSTSLISRAQTLNPDLSRTVEKLSARWVIEEDGRQIGILDSGIGRSTSGSMDCQAWNSARSDDDTSTFTIIGAIDRAIAQVYR